MTVAPGYQVADALAYCRDLTRRRARNFYYGLKLLPEPQRSALYAVYAWMRRADDLADGQGSDHSTALERLESFRRRTDAMFSGEHYPDDPVFLGLHDLAARFQLDRAYFHAMLDGQRDDLNDRQYATFDDLREYCERVASSVGLICIDIWGYDSDRARAHAIDCGIGFQLTNIIRDYVEDYDIGRVYLPADEFAQHDLTPAELRHWSKPEQCRAFLMSQIDRAQRYYDASEPLGSMVTPNCRPTLWAMRAIYRRLLEKMRSDPEQIITGPRIALNVVTKSAIALRAGWSARSSRAVRNGSR